MPSARSRSPQSDEAAATRPRWYRRLGAAWWFCIGLTVLLALSALAAVEPVRDAVTGGSVMEARLQRPVAYVLLAPISAVADTLTLLTVGQHASLLIWTLLGTLAWRVASRRRRTTTSAGRDVAWILGFVAGLVILYAFVAFVPRPMARLAVTQADVIIADFHAHTSFSPDARRGWSPERLRAWYAAAGFDAAYVTDHRTFDGAERGIARNPRIAGEGTMLLQGLETRWRGQHVVILNAGRRYRGLTTDDLSEVDEEALELASLVPGNEPVVVFAHPRVLDSLVPNQGPGTAGVRAIEVVNADPRALTEGRRNRQRILGVADSLGLARVSASDNHGYGRAAAGWTLLRIFRWRDMSTDELAEVIEEALRMGGGESTLVVERRVAGGTSAPAVVLAPLLVTWRMFTTLSTEERVLWLVWIWGAAVVVWAIARRRSQPPAEPQPQEPLAA